MNFDTPQETLAYVGRLLFERRLADFAGGNISLRLGEQIYITPRFSGSRQQWNVDPLTIVSGPIDSDEVLNHDWKRLEKFGEIQVLPFAPSHSQELAGNVVKGLENQRARITNHAAALLLPKHGLFTVSKEIYLCLDAVERIDWNAWCILAQKLMPEA